MKRTINRFVFQKNFCKISSKDSSRYFAIIIPSVLSVFEEIKNLKNIFLQRRFFQIAKYYYNIISSKPKWNKAFGGLKKRYLTCVNIIHTYIIFSVVIKIFLLFFCAIISFFYRKFRQINIHHQRIYIVQQLFAESSPTRFG